MHAIRATDVTKTYGDVTALDELSLSVETGSTFGLLGTNGAGKSTLFRLLVGHVRPDTGTVAVAGRDVADAGHDVRRDVGYLPEHAGFPPSLTGREVLSFHARMRGIARPDRDDRIANVLGTVGLTDAADRAVAGYSNGMNRRLGLATTLLDRPRILLLDEPTAGLDPLGVATFHRVVRRLREDRDLTVVLSSHVLTEVEALCDAVAVLHDGRLLATGATADLKRRIGGHVTVDVTLAPDVARDAAREDADVDGVANTADAVADAATTADAVADAATTADAVVALGERHGKAVRATDRTAVTIDCTLEAVPALLDDLLDLNGVAGYEVSEPGLDQVFTAALDEDAATVAAARPVEVPR